MGKAKNGVGSDRRETEDLEDEIETIRDDLGDIVEELDRRRHEVTDWRLQFRRHKTKILLVAGGVLALIGGLVALQVWRHRERNRPISKVRRLRRAMARMVDDPDNVAQPTPHVGKGILTATGSAVAGALGRKLVSG